MGRVKSYYHDQIEQPDIDYQQYPVEPRPLTTEEINKLAQEAARADLSEMY